MFTQGTLLNERFYLVRKLGEGSFGSVFLSYDIDKKTHVAVKIPNVMHSFDFALNEFRASKMLNNEGFVSFVEYTGRRGNYGADALVFEFIDGIDVDDWLEAQDRQTSTWGQFYTRIFNLLFQISKGILEAHSNGIYHRDLHIGNILIDREKNAPRILDFGMASIIERFGNQKTDNPIVESAENSFIKDVFGSKAILAGRERSDLDAEEKRLLDFHQDLYSFGMLIYSIRNAHNYLYQHYSQSLFVFDKKEDDKERIEKYIADSHYSAALFCVAWRCMHPKIENRPTSLSEVCELLDWMRHCVTRNEQVNADSDDSDDYEYEYSTAAVEILGHFESLDGLLDCLKQYLYRWPAPEEFRFDGRKRTGERDTIPHALVTFDYEGKKFGINNDSDMKMIFLFCRDLELSRQFGNLNPEEVLIEDQTYEGRTALRLKRNFIAKTGNYFSNGFFCYHPHFE